MELPFESITAKDAKILVQGQSDPAAASRHDKDWSTARRARSDEQVKINKDVIAWVSHLPPDIRPRALANQYPRIFNRVVELWKHPFSCEKYLDELLLDGRGSRQGFPLDVADELASLKTHLLETKNIQHIGVWGDRIGTQS
jgi:hypothetical protein